jgi:hypothetical protein
MIQPGGGLGFALEAPAQVVRDDHFRPRHLYGHVPAQEWIECQEDHALAAATQFAPHLEAAQLAQASQGVQLRGTRSCGAVLAFASTRPRILQERQALARFDETLVQTAVSGFRRGRRRLALC